MQRKGKRKIEKVVKRKVNLSKLFLFLVSNRVVMCTIRRSGIL